MNFYDRIKKAVLDTSFVREDISDNTAAEQYYSDLQESLHITDLPIISVNTIEKKTYVLECSSRHFLVFDQYLMEVMRSINSFIMTDCPPDALKVFFYRITSEECYIQGDVAAAVNFGAKYLNMIDYALQRFETKYHSENLNYSYTQQAFLIAHELFHFYVHNNPTREINAMMSKERFLQNIFRYANRKAPEVAVAMDDAIKDGNMIEECLCDSTAVIHAVDVGLKTGELDAVESGLAVALAIMCQYTLSIIQDTVKYSGEIFYERIQSLFNFRLLHLKAFTSLYIKEIESEKRQNEYQLRVEAIHDKWMDNVCHPVLDLLVSENRLFTTNRDSYPSKSEQRNRAKILLQQIYKCAI